MCSSNLFDDSPAPRRESVPRPRATFPTPKRADRRPPGVIGESIRACCAERDQGEAGHTVPAAVEVGLGNVLFLEGELNPGGRVTQLEAAVGPNRARALSRGGPPAGRARRIELVASDRPDRFGPRSIRGRGLTERPDRERDHAPRTRPRATRAGSPPSPAPGPGELVAICMATHEPPPALLRAQIDSIRSQAHRDWVCVISDDASDDAAKAEIERAIAGDARFRLESHQERVGFYRNFERALRAGPSEASYVALCDQDDRWHPDKLAALLSALGPDDVLAHSDARVVDPDGHVVAETSGRASLRATIVSATSCSPTPSPVRPRCFGTTRCVRPSVPGSARPAFPRPLDRASQPRPGRHRLRRAPALRLRPAPGAAHGHARATGPPARTRCATEPRIYAAAASTPTGARRTTEYLARSVSEAMALRLRLSDRLGAADRRRLRMIENLPPPAPPRRDWRRGGSPAHLAAGLASGSARQGVLWRRLVSPRNAWARRRQTRARAHGGSAGRTRDGPTPGPGTASL